MTTLTKTGGLTEMGQREVEQAIARGLSTSQIIAELGVTYEQIQAVRERLDSRAELRVVAPFTPGGHACEQCDRTYSTSQGLAVHRGRAHKAEPAYAEIARGIQERIHRAAEDGPEPVVEPEPTVPDAEPEQPTEAPAPSVPMDARPEPHRSVKDARSITTEFPGGWLELNYEIDWAQITFDEQSALMELTSLLYRLGHVDHFAAVIGDPLSDEFNQGDPA